MKAIVLLSGGLDTAVVLALALEKGRECIAISFDYGQRHKIELDYARKIAKYYGVTQQVITIDPSFFANSSLVFQDDVPKNRSSKQIANGGIPSTYVPARNTLFLAYAIGQAEIFDAQEIYVGPNRLDYTPYPDCRPAFHDAFQAVINLATKQAMHGKPPQLLTPLIKWDKKEIIKQALKLKVPIDMTFSCYDPTSAGQACLNCDACCLRSEALSFAKKTL